MLYRHFLFDLPVFKLLVSRTVVPKKAMREKVICREVMHKKVICRKVMHRIIILKKIIFKKALFTKLRMMHRHILAYLAVLLLSLFSVSSYSSPGAHGPNGEHIEISQESSGTQNPKFETFSESFELVGEIFDSELIVYLHDFASNTPVQFADIELESGSIAVSTVYDEANNQYRADNEAFLSLLQTPGEHEITLTILTEDNGDLLFATLTTPDSFFQSGDESHAPHSDAHHSHTQQEEHHHLPWGTIALVIAFSIVSMVFGMFVSRRFAQKDKHKDMSKNTSIKEYKNNHKGMGENS